MIFKEKKCNKRNNLVFFRTGMSQPEIYASCSTLPSRIENLKEVIDNILQYSEIKKIYIHYPEKCIRLNIDYPPIPEWMNKNERIIVNRTPDWGPMTKFAFMLDIFPEKENVGFLLLDDDTQYPEHWFQSMIEQFLTNSKSSYARHGSLHRHSPFKFCTYNMSKHLLSFRNASTRWGAIYPRSIFPENSLCLRQNFEKYTKDGIFSNDDIILASSIYHSGTSLYLVPTSKPELDIWLKLNPEGNDDDVSLSNTNNTTMKQMRLASKLMVDGQYSVPWPEITVMVVVLVSILLFFTMCLIFLHQS